MCLILYLFYTMLVVLCSTVVVYRLSSCVLVYVLQSEAQFHVHVVWFRFNPTHSTTYGRVVFNIFASGEGRPKMAHERPLLVVIQISKERLHRFCCFLLLVKGDATGQSLAR